MCGDRHLDSLWHSWICLLQARKVNIVKSSSDHILLISGGKMFEGENIVRTDIVFELFLDVNSMKIFLKIWICDLIGYKSVKQSPGDWF